MVKTKVFQLGWTTIYIPYVAVCTLLASGAECACQEHHSLLPLDTGFNGLHPDKASTAIVISNLNIRLAVVELLRRNFWRWVSLPARCFIGCSFVEMIYCF